RDHPALRRRRFSTAPDEHGVPSIAWFEPSGEPMDTDAWNTWFAKSVAMFINGEAIWEPDRRGRRIVDSSFLLLINADAAPLEFTLPDASYGELWSPVLDTYVDAHHEAEYPA